MAVQSGKDLLIKMDMTGAGQFETIAGLRATRLSFNAESVDATHAESAGQWRELLEGAGVRRAAISGAGLFKDQQSDATIRSYFFDGTIRDWQVVIPDFGAIEGPFQVSALEFSGRHDGELTFEIALESAGSLSFQAL